ncbi:MAG: type IV pilus assembly protein PilM [Bdellovibrionales bacterium]|nr:type IV pilus assembly protein PilM [Bdellovibrionales bacterium]
MGLFGGGTSKLIGIDVGASSVKIISGTRSKTDFAVEKFVVVPLPFRSMDDRGILNPDAVADGIRNALSAIGQRKPLLATAVRGPGVLTKRVVIPKIPKKEIPDQVRWEAEQVFPVDVSTILVDHVLLGEGNNVPGAPAGTAGWDVLLVGVRAEDAEMLTNLIENCDGKLNLMDIDAFAVGDFLDGLTPSSPNEAIALVDIGASATHVSVRHKGNVVYLREFPWGGNAFTESLAQALGLSFEDAEAIKIQDGTGIPQEAQDALAHAFQSWKAELQQCEDIFVSQDATATISKWFVFGGASQTPGLLESLRDERFGDRIVPLATAGLFKAKGKVDPGMLQLWSSRLVTAAALSCRKG